MRRTRIARLLCAVVVCGGIAAEAAGQNANMGATFDGVASTALEIKTTFRDAYAITRKSAEGELDTVLYDQAGAPLVALRRDPRRPLVEIGVPGGQWRHRVALARDTSYAPDWNNAQAWILWHDARAAGQDITGPSLPALVFQDHLLRVRSIHAAEQRTRTRKNIDDETVAVETRFPNYVAQAIRRENRQNLRADGVYATFTSRLQALDGTTLGYVRVFAKERIVSWTFTSGERGVAREENVKGGFRFTPNMAWANVQAVWFHEHPPKDPLPKSGRPALAGATLPTCGGGAPGVSPGASRRPVVASLKERFFSWVGGLRFLPAAVTAASRRPAARPLAAPLSLAGLGWGTNTGSAAGLQQPCDGQSDGCTGLHWLDNSIFRPCCDRHDLCYEKDCPGNACTAWSWIAFWDRWECTRCNIAAVFCFLTGGQGGGGGGSGGGSGTEPTDWCWSDLDCPDGYMCRWDGTCVSWF